MITVNIDQSDQNSSLFVIYNYYLTHKITKQTFNEVL